MRIISRNSAFDFFYRHATPPEGRGRAANARVLADCERHFYDSEWSVEWYHARGTAVTRCTLYDSGGEHLRHADYNLQEISVELARVVRAELVARQRGLLGVELV